MFSVSTVTVVGANGVMGCNVAAIFASFGATKVYMVSRDLEKSQKAVQKACMSVKADSIKEKLIPMDYSELEKCIKESELVFESCAEDWDIKTGIHTKIAEIFMKYGKRIVCTGTSGLSVTKLAELYGEEYNKFVFGMHFFNPPYSMTLCELVPTIYSDKRIQEELQEYLQKKLKRVVVLAKDKPAFLANRIGFQFINKAMKMAEQYKYSGGIDYIDAIIGPFTGRAMAPLVTANFVGLDVHKAIVDNLYQNTEDYAHADFVLPEFCHQLIQKGALGRKSGEGLYKVFVNDDGSKTHQVYDIEHGRYRDVIKYTFPFVDIMLSYIKMGNYKAAFQELYQNRSSEAEICCRFLIDYVVYSMTVSNEVAYSVHAADDAMTTGFNWCPPLAIVELFGGKGNFLNLCKLYLNEEQIQYMKIEQIMEKYENTKCDYRKYLRAKR